MKKLFDILSKGFAYAIFLAILIGIDYSFPMAFRTIGLLGTGIVSIATIEWLYRKDYFENSKYNMNMKLALQDKQFIECH